MFETVVLKETPHRWYLRAGPLYPDEAPFIDWLKVLPPNVGTRHQRTYLLTSVREFMKALINMPSAKRHRTMSHQTVLNYMRWTRRLVHWMVERNIWRFSSLESEDVLDFLSQRSYSVSAERRPLASARIFVVLFQWLWDLRHEYHSPLKINPAHLEAQILVTVPPSRRNPWKPLDEAVALPLIRDALAWVEAHGSFVLHVAEALSGAIDSAVGLTRCQLHDRMGATYMKLDADPRMAEARAALDNETAHTFIVVRNLLTQTEGACLIVLLFLVGFRCSELVNLNADSIRLDVLGDGQPIYRLSGVAAKRGGLSRTWVASQPVVEVVEYVTRLYARARKLTGQRALFLSRAGGSVPRSTKTRRLSTVSVAKRIRMFADAPHRFSSPAVIRLHPHAARKTFARFVVLRDKRALESLSYHFGHTHTMITDGCYVGADIELAKLMSEEARKDLAHGLEDILQSGALAGKASRSLQTFVRDAQGGRYRGRRTLQSLVSKLINEGVQLAPCDWGYCVYSQSLSACRGTSSGPNEANRSPEICAGCANFAVTEKHRVWWSERLERDTLFLKEDGIPEQSRKWVSKRLVGTEKVLRELNNRSRDECK